MGNILLKWAASIKRLTMEVEVIIAFFHRW